MTDRPVQTDGQLDAVSRAVTATRHDDTVDTVATISQSYRTDADDLWDACTTAERLARWFGPVSGDLRLGGEYQIENNAHGTVTACTPPRTFTLTWELYGPPTTLVVTVEPDGDDCAPASPWSTAVRSTPASGTSSAPAPSASAGTSGSSASRTTLPPGATPRRSPPGGSGPPAVGSSWPAAAVAGPTRRSPPAPPRPTRAPRRSARRRCSSGADGGQCQSEIFTSCGAGAPVPVSTSCLRLMRNVAHLVLQ